MPVLPSSDTVRARLAEVLAEAEKLKILLRVASEMDGVDAAKLDRAGQEGDQ